MVRGGAGADWAIGGFSAALPSGACRGVCVTAAPQTPQKRFPIPIGEPQFGQAANLDSPTAPGSAPGSFTCTPQRPQKPLPSCRAVPQVGQFIML